MPQYCHAERSRGIRGGAPLLQTPRFARGDRWGIVDEALMIEPTESEDREALDAFCDAMLAIAREAEEDPDLVRAAPHNAPLRRLDEATAARRPVLRWRAQGEPP